MTCAGLVLAAGSARRFGGGKMLAPLAGRPLLQHVLDAAAEAGLRPLVVVLGDDAERVAAQIEWRDEFRVVNRHPARGISGSLLLGLARLERIAGVERVLVLMGDQPLVPVEALAALSAAAADPRRPIVVPRYEDGRPGNPVLLERRAWPLAAGLTGDHGMSALFASRQDLVRYVELPGTNPDIDTPADLETLSRGRAPARSSRTAAGDRSRP